MENPKVSIIIPIFNTEKYLSRCIESVISQTYQNIEVFLINDGSTDSSLSIAKEFVKKDKRIILIDKKNEGVSASRNIGIEKSTGEYLMFVDSDDFLDKRAVEILHNAIIKYDVDIIRYNGLIEKKDKKFKKIPFSIPHNTIMSTKENLIELVETFINPINSLPCYSPLLFLKKKEIRKFNKNLKQLEDQVFYIENLLSDKKILFLDICLYYYTYNENSATKKIDKYIKVIEATLQTQLYLKKILKKHHYDNQTLIDETYISVIMYRLEHLIDNSTYRNSKLTIKYFQENCTTEIEYKYLSKMQKVQYYLLSHRHFLLFYCIIKFKLLLKKMLKR